MELDLSPCLRGGASWLQSNPMMLASHCDKKQTSLNKKYITR